MKAFNSGYSLTFLLLADESGNCDFWGLFPCKKAVSVEFLFLSFNDLGFVLYPNYIQEQKTFHNAQDIKQKQRPKFTHLFQSFWKAHYDEE